MTPISSVSPSSSQFDTVCVIGLGYIGLPTAALIASNRIRVLGVDMNQSHVDQINRGEVPFYEPDFETTLAGVVHRGLLTAQTTTPAAEAYIVAVPTPFTGDYSLDSKYIEAAAEGIASELTGGELIVLESTSPPGTTQKLADYIFSLRSDLTSTDGEPNSVYFAHAPERVLPGRIMVEMAENDRVLGGLTPRGSELAESLYSTFCSGQILLTDARTAEMSKLVENSFRDVNIAFANELSMICDSLNIDVWTVIELANRHPRVSILQPGPGVGGHCIAVDPWFLVAAAPEQAKLTRRAREVNDAKPAFVLAKIVKAASQLEHPTIATLGIAFKPDIEDMRESPSLEIVEALAESLPEADIRVAEPNATELPEGLANRRNVRMQEATDAIAEADIVVLLVDHTPFRRLERSLVDGKIVIDTKGLWRQPSTEGTQID